MDKPLDYLKPTIMLFGGHTTLGLSICGFLDQRKQVKIIMVVPSATKVSHVQRLLEKKLNDNDLEVINIDEFSKQTLIDELMNRKIQLVIEADRSDTSDELLIIQACLEAKVDYVSLIDSQEQIKQMEKFNEQACAQHTVIVTAASLIPALSSMVIEAFSHRLSSLLRITTSVSYGIGKTIGLDFLSSTLCDVGKPLKKIVGSVNKTHYGWQGIHRKYFGDNIGLRWQCNYQSPALSYLPEKYPEVKSIKSSIGLESAFLQFILLGVSWLVRFRLIKRANFMAQKITALYQSCIFSSDNKSGLTIHLQGTDLNYQPLEIHWCLVTDNMKKSNFAIVPILIIVDKLLNNKISPGAHPCVNLFTLEDFNNFIKDSDIYYIVTEN